MKLVPTPTNGHPSTRVRVALSGATYAIHWLWNERDGTWSFSMWDPDGEPLVQGVRVVLNVDLLSWAPRGDRRPPYGIVAVDPSERLQEPARDTLGTRIKVVYLEPDEAAP
jgi:hypothetical protein